jgi:transposase
MVWAAFCSLGTLDIAFVSTSMNSEEYQQVLNNHLLPYLRRFRRKPLVFQQDNASVHRSHSTNAWMQEHHINVLPFPARSPDLNPMENLWGIIVRDIYANNRQYQCIQDLRIAILQAWNRIDKTTILNLMNSMPNRLFQVINRSGGLSDY